jgi:hypothetical protein
MGTRFIGPRDTLLNSKDVATCLAKKTLGAAD